MEQYLKWLDENQWLNLIFLVLAILSIIISVYLYRKSQKKRRPVYDKRSINVISDQIKNIGNLEISYKGEKIENLTVTKVAFWNDGNETINSDDQAPTDKLRIEINEGYNILESEVIFQSSVTNNIQTQNLINVIQLSFDYLDPNQGGIIKFIHTGTKSSDVNLRGTFKGSDKLKKINLNITTILAMVLISFRGKTNRSTREIILFQKLLPWTVLITGIVFGCVFYFIEKEVDRIIFLVLGSLYSFAGMIMIFNQKKMPKGFEIFLDDE